MQQDIEYFARREREERSRAAAAADARTKAAHEELAQRYKEVVRAYGFTG